MDNNNKEKTEIAKKIADKTNKISSNFSIMEEYFVRFFRFISSVIDNFMFSSKYIGIASLVLALILYFLLGVQDNSITKALSSSKTINSVNINTRYNSESFEVSGLPTRCDVIVTGDAASVSNSTTNKNGYCLIDLEGYTEGTHFVKVNAFGYGDSVTATAVPSNAQVTLKRKTTSRFPLSYDFINGNLLDPKYILGTPEFGDGDDYVNIRASQDTLNSISLVKALIDVKGQTKDFTIDAPLVAYNSRGQQVEAEIVPSSVKASVKITSPSKTVPITLRTKGSLSTAGLAIEKIQISGDTNSKTTEIYGNEKALDGVSAVYVDLDLSTITSNTTVVQPVTLPTGITSSSVSVVSIDVVLDTAVTKTFEGIPLNYINNSNGYGVSTNDSLNITVTVTGTQNTIDNITKDNIFAYVDFKDLALGETYDLPILFDKKDTDLFFSMECESPIIHLTIVNKN